MDLCIVLDSTGSMGNYINSLKESIYEYLNIPKLCNDIDKIGILEYKDYGDKVFRWSGWSKDLETLEKFLNNVYAYGGGDIPEASKTAAFELTKVINKKTLVIWYTDAPPHNYIIDSLTKDNDKKNLELEKKYLGEYFDWIKLCDKLKTLDCNVWFLLSTTFNEGYLKKFTKLMYSYMSFITRGKNICLETVDKDLITRITINIILLNTNHNYIFENLKECYLEFKTFDNEKELINYYTNIPLQYKYLESKEDIKNSIEIKRFITDMDYKSLVYKIFKDIIDKKILSIKYNPLFGSLWREICKDVDDERSKMLKDKLSIIVETLSGYNKSIVRKIIEESYNQKDVIEDLIKECVNKFPALVLKDDNVFDKMNFEDILEITRSFNNKTLEKLSKILRNVKIINDENFNKTFIPLELNDNDFFSCIPHLIVNGCKFNKRSSIIVAMLAVYNDITILKRAKKFLLDNKGLWFKDNNPENFSYSFIKFVLKINSKIFLEDNNEILTETEKEFFNIYHTIGGLKINQETKLNIKTPFSINRCKKPDYKIECIECKNLRSFTILDKNKRCGLCLFDKNLDFPTKDKENSYWCECSKCKSYYVVENIDKLNKSIKPKCHFCRNNILFDPAITCISCKNKFITCLDMGDNWCCPICKYEKLNDETIEIPFKNYLKGIDNIYNLKSLWAIYEKDNKMPKYPKIEYPEKYNNKIINNLDEIKEVVKKWIDLEKSETDYCLICFNENFNKDLEEICDSKKCKTRACKECLKSWYEVNKPGIIFSTNNVRCIFCRKRVSIKTIKKYNKNITLLKNYNIKDLDDKWYYGWCMNCHNIKKYIEKQCSINDPLLDSFICEFCNLKENKIKECPSCGVMVEKISGCDHISCKCGIHWCFNCRKECLETEIYDHINNEHGNLGYDEDIYFYSDEEF